MSKAIKYSFGAIALYLVVYWAGGASEVLKAGSTGASGLVKAFQGR